MISDECCSAKPPALDEQSSRSSASGPDQLLCYCFGITYRQARFDPSRREFVAAMTREKKCDCATKNPSGRCCLPDFPEPITIREAQEGDIEAMSGLLGELFAAESDFTPDRERQRRGLKLILSDRSCGRIHVASDGGANAGGGRLVGMINMLYTISTAFGARVALLEDLIVAADYRQRGVATALLERALAEAAAHGCERVTLLTDADNIRAQSLYRRHGFVESQMRVMRLRYAH